MTTDPTTLRTALEALYVAYDGLRAIAAFAPTRGIDSVVAEARRLADAIEPALATPAPAADEARCEVCGEPTAMGQGLIVIDGKRQHQTCYMGIDQPAPTPAPPTPPATEEGPAVVVAHWGGDPDSCSLHGDIPRDVSPAEHVRELHAAEIDAWERVSIDGHPGWAEPTPPATEPVAALVDLRSRFVRDLQDDNMGLFDGEMPVRLDAIVAAARAEAGVSVDRYIESVPPLDFIVMQRVRRGRSMSWEVYDMPNTDSPREAATGPTLAAALAARSAGSGSRVERECVCGHGWADHGLTGGCEAEWGTGDGDVFCPCTHTRPTPPPAGATQVPLPATDSTPPPAVDGTRCGFRLGCGGRPDDPQHQRPFSGWGSMTAHDFEPNTPPPAVDGTRCAECGGVKDDVFHVPCLVGGPFHYVKTCHPFTPPTPADPFCTDTWVQGEETRP